jgi:hypothetical protein
MRFIAMVCLGGLLFFALPAHAQDAGEITFWESVKDSKNPAELQTYLEAYPEGKFATLARIRIKALGGTPQGAAAAPETPAPTEPPAGEAGNEPSAPFGAPATPPGPSSETRAQANWNEFRSAPGGFTVLLPGEPKVTVVPPDQNGRSEHRFLVDFGDKAYLVAWDDYAPGHLTKANPTMILDAAQGALLKGVNGTLRNSKAVTIGGYPGREFLFDTPDHNTGKVRVYVVRNRLYQVWYLGPTGQETRPDVDKFLNSFQLTRL